MPIYDYRCKKCNNIQEELRAFSNNSKVKCSKCSSVCERIISASNFVCDGCTTYNDKIKKSMLAKNKKMDKKMKEKSSESVKNLGDLKKKKL